MDSRRFYDEMAPYYDLIFEDWDASMARQGDAIRALIEAELGSPAGSPGASRVLDAACGIGTQALALAARGLAVDAGVSDMREVGSAVTGRFDAVIAFDNSIPHLLTDRDILDALREFLRVLRPGGIFFGSVRDYDLVERGVPSTHPYGDRVRGAEIFRLRQEWTWDDPMRYAVTLVVERAGGSAAPVEMRTTTRYYAVSIARLLELMAEAGFVDCRRVDGAFYQPVLTGRRPTQTMSQGRS